MQCAILAGGLATRMRPLTERAPKALLEVAGRPFADWQLSWLASQGVSDVVYCIAHLGQLVRDHVGDGSRFGLSVTYADEGPVLAGTAGALARAASSGLLQPRFAVLYGDSWLDVDIGQVWRRFEHQALPMLMTVYRNNGRFDRSNVCFDGNRVVRYDKQAPAATPGMDHIDYGLLLLERVLVEPPAVCASDLPLDLAVLQHRLSAAGKVAGYEVSERFYEIGSPEGLAALDAHLRAQPPG